MPTISATEGSATTSKTGLKFLTILPREVRDIIYALVIGDHTIHIKSDVIPEPESQQEEEDDDDDEEEEEYDDDEEDTELPEDFAEILSDDRGPLYHTTCDNDLLHPRDARLYRIRTLKANSNGISREQADLVLRDFKHVNYPELSDPTLTYESVGSLSGEDEEEKPAVQVKLAFLRVNKQLYSEAATLLYSTRTFGFDDATTFAQFFSITYNHVTKPPTLTSDAANLPPSKRTLIRSLNMRARTALALGQKIRWMAALDSATFVLPRLAHIRILFDLCHEGKSRYVDRTLWPYYRHQHGFAQLKTAEVHVATDLQPVLKREVADDRRSCVLRDVRWRVELSEAILGHHLDVLFGGSLLDAAAVAERNATFRYE